MAVGFPTTVATSDAVVPAAEQELYAYICNIKDAATKKDVTCATRLVPLYQLNDPHIDNELLRNLTGIAQPGTFCQLVQDDKTYPPLNDQGEHGYCMVLTYNKLLDAPVVRLECRLYDGIDRKSGVYLTLVLEFHWGACGDIGPGVANYEIKDHSDKNFELLTFDTRGSTSSGFPHLVKCKDRLSQSGEEVIEILKGLLHPDKSIKVKLLLDRPIHAETAKVRSYLPGGKKFVLSSLSRPEWNMYRTVEGRINLKVDELLRPKKLIKAQPPHPLVPLECSDTFSSLDEAALQLGYSAHIADEESQLALSLWTQPSTPHRATLYSVGQFVVMAVDFGPFRKLGSITDDAKFRLPENLRTEMRFIDPSTGQDEQCCGDLVDLPLNIRRPHDAFFIIAARDTKKLSEACVPFDYPKVVHFDIAFSPRHDTFTITSQISTTEQLRQRGNKRWTAILLNQLHDTIPLVDLTSDPNLDKAKVELAYAELEGWMHWNAEQLEAIQGLKKTKGGFLCVMGPAGTGKTLLQQALATFFWRVGYHVLALAPANSNANHLTREMARKSDGVDFLRLYSASLSDNLHELRTKESRDEAPLAGEASGLRDLQFELIKDRISAKTKKTDAKDHDVQRAVLRAAAEGVLEKQTRLEPNGHLENCWDVLRQCLAEIEAGTFELADDTKKGKYSRAYSHCKGHIVSLSRFIISTTGNVRNADLMDNWAKDLDGVKCLGVVVFIDEAAKDVEINAWSGIVCEGWAHHVKGVVMFGDDKQLKPTNTSQKGRLNFNAFNARLDMSLPCRLVSQNFPCVRLKEQRRMHACISAFPNQQFYEGTLVDGPGTHRTLKDVEPGLTGVLHGILAKTSTNSKVRVPYAATATDEQARLAYIEIAGIREKHERTNSVVVKEHIGVFFKRIFPGLLQHFGDGTNDKVMIICAYSHAKNRWHRALTEYQNNNHLDTSQMPRLVTLDSSQGQEAFMVVFDGSFQHSDRMGFLTDSGRCNVAMTRAQHVFWILGGALGVKGDALGAKSAASIPDGLPHFALYKKKLQGEGKVHNLGEKRALQTRLALR